MFAPTYWTVSYWTGTYWPPGTAQVGAPPIEPTHSRSTPLRAAVDAMVRSSGADAGRHTTQATPRAQAAAEHRTTIEATAEHTATGMPRSRTTTPAPRRYSRRKV